MPLKIDVKVNDELVERVHIARINTGGGTSDDTFNDYSVVRASKDLLHTDEPPFDRREFKDDLTWTDWLEPDAEFEHRYGDGPLVCLMKALRKLNPELEAAIPTSELEAENVELRKRVAELEAKISAPPF